MLTLTRDQFKAAFGIEPGKLFDLTRILTPKHRIEAMQLATPGAMRMRREYLTMSHPGYPTIIAALEVGYWTESGRFRATIRKIILFDSQAEFEAHRAVHGKDSQQWNEN